jgi:type I restriction enzyme S subunit
MINDGEWTMKNYQLSIKRYSSYKDSTIEWLGDVPEHWEVRRLKEVIVSPLSYGANEMATDSNPEHPRFIRITDFSENEELKDETFKSLSPNIAQKYLLKEGDILFARSGATIGKTFHFKNYKGKACYAGYLIKARPNPNIISSNFLSYYTKSSLYDTWKSQVFIKATIENISAEKYGFFLFIPLPPLAEQKSIATYLDTKTAQIDRKIDLLTQKVKSYADLKRSIINETVTCGLDRSVAMKDSAIEWLGDVPEHWQVKRIKDVGINGLTNGLFKKKHDFGFGTKLINVSDLYQTNNTIKYEPLDRVNASEEETNRYKVLDGDIFFVRSSLKLEGIGISALLEKSEEATVFECHIIRFRPNSKVAFSRFLIYLFNSEGMKWKFIIVSKTVTMTTISQEKISSIELAIPPLLEQKTIATYLDTKTAQIDQIIQNINTQIEKLKELRKTLINDVVTGKIRVTEPQ